MTPSSCVKNWGDSGSLIFRTMQLGKRQIKNEANIKHRNTPIL